MVVSLQRACVLGRSKPQFEATIEGTLTPVSVAWGRGRPATATCRTWCTATCVCCRRDAGRIFSDRREDVAPAPGGGVAVVANRSIVSFARGGMGVTA